MLWLKKFKSLFSCSYSDGGPVGSLLFCPSETQNGRLSALLQRQGAGRTGRGFDGGFFSGCEGMSVDGLSNEERY